MHGPEQEARPPDPVGERRAVQREALPREDLRLPVERKMVGVFGHEHLCDGRIRWQPALDQARWCRRLKDDVLAGAAGVFGPTNDQNAELRRHDVEALGDVLTDPVERARTAGARPALHVDDALDPRQMGRQSTPVGSALGNSRSPRVRRRVLGCGKPGRLDLLSFLQTEQELVGRQGLRAAPEAMALQLLDNQAKALALGTLGQHHRLEQAWVVRKQMRRRAHESK